MEKGEQSAEYAPYPKLTPEDVAPPPPPPVGHLDATTVPPESNPYISPSATAPSSIFCVFYTMGTVRDVLDKFGKKVNEAAKKTEDLAGNFWQHLKTGPSIADAAMGRISQTTRVISEGDYDKIFQQTFETFPDEKLKKSYACYLSTSAGPIIGVLYLSTAKLAFCSDNPLSYKVGDQTQWTYYKVVIPLHQIRSVDRSASRAKPGEKYIQVVSIDNHEFWFMGLVNYDSAVRNLLEAVHGSRLQV